MARHAASGLSRLLRGALVVTLSALGACSGEDAVPEETPESLGLVGTWSAWLESPGGLLEFGLELTQVELGGHVGLGAELVNGSERIEVLSTSVGQEKWIEPPVTRIDLLFPHYDSRIEAELLADGSLAGEWTRSKGDEIDARLPFGAVREPSPATSRGASPSLAGRWAVDFESDDQPAVGVFESAADGVLTGTFLTTTGDYRFLAGRQDGGAFSLSCFDGAHAFLFTGELQDDGTLLGEFFSRDVWHETFRARRDDSARLPDGFTLTRWTEDGDLSRLSFPDLEGTERSLDDPEFAGRARILQVFGSWCPNCHDASEALADLHERYGQEGLSIVGLAFERSGDFERDAEQVRHYARRHGVTWPLLVAGLSSKAEAGNALPVLDAVRSYPTTIFLHGDGRVRAVYQGFVGPAAPEEHAALLASFEGLVEELLAEEPPG